MPVFSPALLAWLFGRGLSLDGVHMGAESRKFSTQLLELSPVCLLQLSMAHMSFFVGGP